MGLILGFGCLNVQATEVQKVAVYVTGGNDDGIKKILGDQMVSAFSGSGRYIAVERTGSFLAELRKEQSYQQTGAVDDRELSRLGIQFGVKLVCVVEMNEAFGQKYISSRLIDVESAEVINTANETSELKDMNELLRVCKSLATVLTGKTEKEKIAEKIAAQEAAEKAQKAKEAERIAAEKQGYLVIDNMIVTYPPAKSITWNEANAMATSNGAGWSLPTLNQARRIAAYIYELWKDTDKSSEYKYTRYWTSNLCSTGNANYHSSCGLESTSCRSINDRDCAVIVKAKNQ